MWRKSVGVEPTRDVVRPSPDLKTGRPTGVRSSSSSTFIMFGKNGYCGALDAAVVTRSFGKAQAIEVLE